ncbi:hypothetical protein KKG90_03180 [Candidatus Bipolaricaulota bacterium]|nr:hypothetical protein [Candidatus Bipolaricaulota bacterium]
MKKKTEQEAPRNLLKDLCGSDNGLYDYLSRNLYETPMTAISKKDLDALTQEGERNGNFGPAIDKAIFESSQHEGEAAKYAGIIRDLSSKAIGAVQLERQNYEKQGLVDRVASLDHAIEQHKFLSERTEDVLKVASKFYAEKMLELDESTERKERDKKRSHAENEEQVLKKRELAGRNERKRELRKMGRKERKLAKQQDKLDQAASEEQKVARGKKREAAAQEDLRIREKQQQDRNIRQDERSESSS